MPRGFSLFRLAALATLLLVPSAARAAKAPPVRSFTINFTTAAAPVTVEAEEIRGRMWVNFSKIAPALGARRREADGGELWEFSGHQVLFWGGYTDYRIRDTGKKAWKTEPFERNMFYDGTAAMVPISALPALCRRTFSYHRQRHELSTETAPDAARGRRVAARHQRHDGNDWVSLEDAAKALGIVIFNTQPNRFRLVMPDFTILELKTGDTTVSQRDIAYARLADPMLLFDGSPYLTVRSLRSLLGADVQWDAADGTLVVPARYGRVAQAAPPPDRLVYRGYAAEPFAADVEELSVFYQEPMPVYAADHPDVYESVRDLLTDEPIVRESSVADRVSGNAVVSLTGNTGGTPFSGRGAFEKIGDKTHVVNGTVRWGFPGFRVEGGRQYLTFGGLVGQFNVVDAVTVSHSTDRYGDGDQARTFDVRAGYGQHDFSLYLSTATFSQTVRMKQRYGTAGVDGEWKGDRGGRLSARLTHFSIENDPVGTESSFYDEDLLREIFGDDFTTTVEPADAAALTRTAVATHHDTTLLNLVYDAGKALQLSSSLGVSRYQSDDDGAVVDTDALARAVIGQKRRLDVSFERSGANYRSLGDPTRYRDRKILRVAPSVEIAKPWRVLGEFRREDSASLKDQGVAPYTNVYMSLTNLLLFKPGSVRTTVTDYDSSLYGGRRSAEMNLTKNLGRDSLELGGGVGRNRLASGTLFRRSTSARAGYQVLRPGKRFSVGHEYTWHSYPAFFARAHETESTLLAEIARWRALAQYAQTPKSFLSPEVVRVGTFSVGRRLSDSRLFSLFYSAASARGNLSHPSAWRAGLELTTTFQ